MRVLLIKTSSLGDIIHTFPAITDATKYCPNLSINWIVEEGFSQIPLLHPAVKEVFPIAIRRWRKKLQWSTLKEIKATLAHLRLQKYDIIIDAQGLFKSSFLSLFTYGKRYGYSWQSAREPIASLFYQQTFDIPWNISSVNRTRELFAKTFGYTVPQSFPQAGIALVQPQKSNKILFLPGASWVTKKWPLQYWIELAQLIKDLDGVSITIPWSTLNEYDDALKIQEVSTNIQVLPKMDLGELASIIATHRATIAVDSGLGYLSAALQIPTIILWGPTSPKLIGKIDVHQHNLVSALKCSPCFKRDCKNKNLSIIQPPCFAEITPKLVWQELQKILIH